MVIRGLAIATSLGILWLAQSYRTEQQAVRAALASGTALNTRLELALQAAGTPPVVILPQDLLWQAEGDRTALQKLQSYLLEEFRGNGLQVRQYQQVTAPEAGTDAIAMRLEFSGTLEGLVAVLQETGLSRPAVAISSLQIRPLASREQTNGATAIVGQIVVWGLAGESDA